MLLTLSGSFIKIQYSSFSVIPRGVPLPHSNALQYYVKREKCKVNDVIFPSGCEAGAINLGNKNMKNRYFHGWYQCKIEKYTLFQKKSVHFLMLNISKISRRFFCKFGMLRPKYTMHRSNIKPFRFIWKCII